MRNMRILKTLLSVTVAGSALCSCATDARDAAIAGVMDAITGTISGSLMAAVPLPECIGTWWSPCPAPEPNEAE